MQLITPSEEYEDQLRVDRINDQVNEENCAVTSNVVETKPAPESKAEYTDLSCYSSETADAVLLYLTEQVNQQEERPAISAYVEKATLRITYNDVRDRGEWDMQLMGYRDGYEALQGTKSAEGGNNPDVNTASSVQPSPDSYSITEAANYIAYETIKSSEGWNELPNEEWDQLSEKLAGEILEFVDERLKTLAGTAG